MKKTVLFRLTALVLVLAALAMPAAAATAEPPAQPMASLYLSHCSASVSPMGSGKIHVEFSTQGTKVMDEIGALTIRVYESTDNVNFTWVKTYQNRQYSSMLGYNKSAHTGYVSYQGVAGRYYKAYVNFYAALDGGSDAQGYYTPARQAT